MLSVQQGLHPLKFSPLRATLAPLKTKLKAPASAPAPAPAPTPAPAPAPSLPATTAPWAALARDTVESVRLAEVMQEQEQGREEEGQGWQVVKDKKRAVSDALPASSSSSSSSSSSDLKLYVYLMPARTTRAHIISHFGSNVNITGPCPSSGVAQGKTHCWLTCSDSHLYDRLLQLNNTFMDDHQIRVEPARPKRAAAPPAPASDACVKEVNVGGAAAATAAACTATAAAEVTDHSSDMCKWYAACDAAGDDASDATCSICQDSSLGCRDAVRTLCVCKQVR